MNQELHSTADDKLLKWMQFAGFVLKCYNMPATSLRDPDCNPKKSKKSKARAWRESIRK